MKTKLTFLAVLLASASWTMLAVTSARSQTYKTDFSTQLILAAGGVDPIHALTIKAAPGTTPYTLTMPASVATGAGFVLTSDASGNLTWTDPALGVTLAGDITGAAGANHIANTAGNDIVTALNDAQTTDALNVPVGFTATSLTAASGGAITTTGAINGGTGVFSSTLSAAGLTSTAGVTTSGGAANISTTDASAVNLGTGSFANAISIGNGNGSSGTYSTTTVAGLVNFTGAVSLPSGSLSATSIGLAQNNIFVGNSGGDAAPLAPSNSSVLVTDASGNVSWGTSLPSGLTIPGASISNPTFTGTITLPTNSVTNADLQNSSLTVAAGSGLSGGGSVSLGGTTTLALDMTSANSWSALQTMGAGLTVAGGATNIATTDASAVNIGTGANANAIHIGNGDGVSSPSSTTTLAGTVNFTGAVSLPTGSVSASSLSLANNDVLIGNGSGGADSAQLTQDLTVVNSGSHVATATINGSHATTFAVANNATVGGTLHVTGQTTLGSSALSAATLAAPSGAVLALGTASSYYILTDNGSPETYSSITGANQTTGQMIVIENASTTPGDYLTLTSGAGLALNGGNVILADGGTISLIYDGTNWRAIGQ